MNNSRHDWDDVELGEFGEIVAGGTPSRAVSSFWNGNISWVTPSEITALKGKYLYETREQITHEGLTGSAAKLLPVGTLLVTSRATLGEVAIAGVPVTTNQGFKSIIPNEETDSLFAYYLMATLKPEMERLASGTTFLEISKADFSHIRTLRPPLAEQSRIAAVLDTVDAAIAQTEAMIAKLKQVRAGLLHDLLTRGLDEHGQLRPPPAEAPHLYQDSPLGKMPRGWEICLLDDVAIRGSGHTPSKDVHSYWNGGVKWVSLADSDKLDRIYISETDKEISDLGIENSSAVKHPPGTVILSRDAGIGKSAILSEEMAVSQHFIAWRCSKRLNSLFLYYWLQHNKPRFEAIAMGSTIKTIGLPFFKLLQITLPTRREQDDTSEVLLAVEDTLSGYEREFVKLKMLKSALMSDLLTGRVRVPADIFKENL